MTVVRVQQAASLRIDEIYQLLRVLPSGDPPKPMPTSLAFSSANRQDCDRRCCLASEIPVELGVNGYVFRYEKHLVYWKTLDNGDIGIVTVLHERMHQIDRFREDFGESSQPR